MKTLPCPVLVVDDDREIRDVLAAALADEGYQVCTAQDGRQALGILMYSVVPMVVLLDNRMPGMDGAALLEIVAGDASLSANNAYALITAEPQAITPRVERLLRTLDVPVLEKPFDLDQLLQTVEDASCRLRWPTPRLTIDEVEVAS